MKFKIKDLRDWGFFALALTTLIFAVLTFILTLETTSKNKPDIEIALIDNHQFSTQEVADIYGIIDGTSYLKRSYLNFRITNFGQTGAEYLNFYMKDKSEEYGFNSKSIENLPEHKNDFFQIEFWNNNCSEIFRKNENINISSRECNQIRKDLTLGNKELLLRLDCPTCGFKESDRCYSIKICIYNYGDKSCAEEYLKDYILKEISCHENW